MTLASGIGLRFEGFIVLFNWLWQAAISVRRFALAWLFIVGSFASLGSAQALINEVLYRVDPANSDPLKTHQWVELYNKGADPVDLTGWIVSGRNGSTGASARTLPSLSLPAHGYLVVHLTQGTDRTDFSDGTGDVYTQDADAVWSTDMDEAALYSLAGIVDFIAWRSAAVPFSPGTAHNDAVAAGIWTKNAALNSDRVVDRPFERPRFVALGESIGRDPDSTDTDRVVDFEPHGGIGAFDNSPNRRNLDKPRIVEFDPPSEASAANTRRAASAQKKWTIMLFFNGDNTLQASIFKNALEIKKAGGSDANVNFVLQYDRKSFQAMDQTTSRGLIVSNGDLNDLSLQRRVPGESVLIGDRDMGDPKELAEFVAWAKTYYPADHYALILSGHGDGWKGFGPDESSLGTMTELSINLYLASIVPQPLPAMVATYLATLRNGGKVPDWLYMGELRTALARQHFDLIGFDACLMAGIEVADQVRDFTDYFLASEAEIPGEGYPYDTFSTELKSNPDMTALALGSRIVELYRDRYSLNPRPVNSVWGTVRADPLYTMSLVDESRLIELIQQVDAWSALLKTGAGLFQGRDNPEDNVQVRIKFDLAASQFFIGEKNYVDLYDLAQHIKNDNIIPECVKGPITNILTLIDGPVVVLERHGTGIKFAKGMHIYFPTNRQRKSAVEDDDDYDLPDTRQTDGSSQLAVYAQNHDQLPLKARDRELPLALNPRTEWPEPPTPDLRFIRDTRWSLFLERYYHPVADNRILPVTVDANGKLINPPINPTTASGGGACSNPSDSITVPVGTTVMFSGAGSSDADMPDLPPVVVPGSPPVSIPSLTPYAYFWDLDDTKSCTRKCTAPAAVPDGTNPTDVDNATTNMNQDLDGGFSPGSLISQRDIDGARASRRCDVPGTFKVTLMVWDDNHLNSYHDTLLTAEYVHPQTDRHQATVICVPPQPRTDIPISATLKLDFLTVSDLFVSSGFVGLTSGNLNIIISGTQSPQGLQVSVVGDRAQLVPATGPFDATKRFFDIQGTSTGPIAGFQGVQARYTLTIAPTFDTVSGTYQVGLNNTLNNEPQPVTYKVTGTITNQKYAAP